MIVDDSRVARLALARRLGARGIEVTAVASGPDAIAKLRESRPDVVFMDYMMPEMDGLEACRLITGNGPTADLPIIMTTSNDTPEFRDRGVASGASGFLSKGLEDRELDNVLDAVARRGVDMKTEAASMRDDEVELSAETVEWIRDQAINAARNASEDYFSAQLPGLEEQVVQIAESAARNVAVELMREMRDQGGGGAPAQFDVAAIRAEMDEAVSEQALKKTVLKIVRDESRNRRDDKPKPRETVTEKRVTQPSSSGSFLGGLIRWILIALILVVVVYIVSTNFFPDSSVATYLTNLLQSIQGGVSGGQ